MHKYLYEINLKCMLVNPDPSLPCENVEFVIIKIPTIICGICTWRPTRTCTVTSYNGSAS